MSWINFPLRSIILTRAFPVLGLSVSWQEVRWLYLEGLHGSHQTILILRVQPSVAGTLCPSRSWCVEGVCLQLPGPFSGAGMVVAPLGRVLMFEEQPKGARSCGLSALPSPGPHAVLPGPRAAQPLLLRASLCVSLVLSTSTLWTWLMA